MNQKIIRCSNIEKELYEALSDSRFSSLFVLVDTTTERLCLPRIESVIGNWNAKIISIKPSDEHKNLQTLASVWEFLSKNGANRRSIMINLGGGMPTDLGGFAAATFKRGIRFFNIPTTLLGAVDAAVGGKTGINFNGLKNEIGAFRNAEAVLIDASFFKTLDTTNLLSGYAELLKHALIAGLDLTPILTFDFENIDYDLLTQMVFESVQVKQNIVNQDPTEQGIRKALNLGHTVGHAFESLALERQKPVPHGYAVAWGLVCELYLSFIKLNFNKETLSKITRFVKENYGIFTFGCEQYPHLIELMRHDKKNDDSAINFTFVGASGKIEINQTANREEIEEAFDYFREN